MITSMYVEYIPLYHVLINHILTDLVFERRVLFCFVIVRFRLFLALVFSPSGRNDYIMHYALYY